ncbi:MAG: type I glyceraldehyde-3-phosphate dehydrogenase [Sporocytophaga sp.]|uniref:type I glyceraldehyde-3-phosphate dehydrogenase n=1 Tax=Sporocytophaga sp. TaxID=2231183 RepID=UPI001B19C9BA|nr:type I glyceraldehyde-3-phosphate dehydrogenase [Sporocytophaga sp.]MBO9702409.1 type I glyceraldehyde-3-phosphate dehydrogenase [Sporocytophaga sp.]
MTRVAINGLGRIGRATFKILIEDKDMELVAVNDIIPPSQLAYLLNFDTVYGKMPSKVNYDDHNLYVNGKTIRVTNIKEPQYLPWRDMGVDVVFECSGIFRKREELQLHLNAGAKQVILSAPAKTDDVQTIVHGVNQPEENDNIISTASCTTNCITPVIEILSRRIGVKKAVLNTIHAYTSSQSLVDGPSKDQRRGRAAASNLIPTTTGAARVAGKVLPEFSGKFDGLAIRGPIPAGSIADITLVMNRNTSVEEINKIFGDEAGTDRYMGVVGVNIEPIVSSDIIMDPRAAVIDLSLTQVIDGDLVKIMAWYDNEWGYVNQMVKEAKRVSKLQMETVII